LSEDVENATGTVVAKLAHVRTWIKVAHNKSVYVKFFGKAAVEQVHPHIAYKEKDIYRLIRALKEKSVSMKA